MKNILSILTLTALLCSAGDLSAQQGEQHIVVPENRVQVGQDLVDCLHGWIPAKVCLKVSRKDRLCEKRGPPPVWRYGFIVHGRGRSLALPAYSFPQAASTMAVTPIPPAVQMEINTRPEPFSANSLAAVASTRVPVAANG